MKKIIKVVLIPVILFGFIFFESMTMAQQEDQSADFIFKGKLVNGKIKDIMAAENIITVDSYSGEVIDFLVEPAETVIWIDDEEKDINALEVGMEAELKYTENEREQNVLSWVDIVLNEELEGTPEFKEKEKIKKEKATETLKEPVKNTVAPAPDKEEKAKEAEKEAVKEQAKAMVQSVGTQGVAQEGAAEPVKKQ